MTEPPAMSHDFDAAYADRHMGETAAAFTGRTSADGLGVVVEGDCPRCHGRTVTEYRHGLPGTGSKGLWSWLSGAADDVSPASGSVAATLVQETHFCECGHPHPQLPGDAAFVGCGASWRVRTLFLDGSP